MQKLNKESTKISHGQKHKNLGFDLQIILLENKINFIYILIILRFFSYFKSLITSKVFCEEIKL